MDRIIDANTRNEDDLSDILDFLSEELQGADVSVSNGEVITIDYSSFKNDISI